MAVVPLLRIKAFFESLLTLKIFRNISGLGKTGKFINSLSQIIIIFTQYYNNNAYLEIKFYGTCINSAITLHSTQDGQFQD